MSLDLTMFPFVPMSETPTDTKQPLLQLTEEEDDELSVVVVLAVVAVLLLSDFAQEETSTAILTMSKLIFGMN